MKVKLGDVCDKITDGSHNPPKGIANSEYLMLSSKNISDDCINLDNPRYLSEEDFIKENKRTNISANDLLMTIVGTIGRVAIVPDNLTGICVQRSVAVLKTKQDIIVSRFLMYKLQNMCPYLEQESIGVAQKGIYLKKIANLLIDVPPLDEQRHIVAVLDKVSDLIALRKKQLAKLDELVKARFVEMFGDLTVNTFRWNFIPLSELCDVRDGTHDSPKYIDYGYPLLTSKNFTSGIIDFTDCNMISKEDFDKINLRSKVDIGDIIMPMIGTIGNPIIVKTDKLFAIKNVALIKFKDNKISNIFIKEILNSCYFYYITMVSNRGGTQKFIALGDIRKLPIPVVSLDLQQQFADFVEQIDKQKTIIQRSLDKLEMLKKSLMQEYFG